MEEQKSKLVFMCECRVMIIKDGIPFNEVRMSPLITEDLDAIDEYYAQAHSSEGGMKVNAVKLLHELKILDDRDVLVQEKKIILPV